MNSSTSYLKMSMLYKSLTNKYMIMVKKKKKVIDKIMKNMIKLFCQVLNVQNNWQIVNTNLSKYRFQSLQVLLNNA